MAYFSNGSEGMAFDEQCEMCKGRDKPCPIAFVQEFFNYDALNNDIATKILNELVKNDGTCMIFKMFKNELKIIDDEDLKNQGNLF